MTSKVERRGDQPRDGATSPANEVCHKVVCDDRCSFPSCMGPERAIPPAPDPVKVETAVDTLQLRALLTALSVDEIVHHFKDSALFYQADQVDDIIAALVEEAPPHALATGMRNSSLIASARQEAREKALEEAAKLMDPFNEEGTVGAFSASRIRSLAAHPGK